MTDAKLIAEIKTTNPITAKELADGIIAVQYENDEYVVFHDTSTYKIEEHAIRPAKDLPSNWEEVAEIARHHLRHQDGKVITNWHKKPIDLEL